MDTLFEKELKSLINKYSEENQSNSPDYVLAQFLINCLEAFNQATRQRDKWYMVQEPPWPGGIPRKKDIDDAHPCEGAHVVPIIKEQATVLVEEPEPEEPEVDKGLVGKT